MTEALETPEVVLRRLLDRDTEICMIRQRIELLLDVPDRTKLVITDREDTNIMKDGPGMDDPASASPISLYRGVCSQDSLKARLTAVSQSRQQASACRWVRVPFALIRSHDCNGVLRFNRHM